MKIHPDHPVECLIYTKREDGSCQCGVCPRRCIIHEGSRGFCRGRKNIDGTLYALNYGRILSMAVSPIEKKPLFHFYPGSMWISMGTFGCNFRCHGCQNWSMSHADGGGVLVSASEVVEYARRFDCLGISWTYNEPSVWLEFIFDSARKAKENGLLTHLVTNGYITPDALDTIGPYIDCFRVDIKGFSEETYTRIAGIKDFSAILEATKRAKFRWEMHVECVTNIIPGYNDSEIELNQIASWISKELGRETPWHVTRFFPQFGLSGWMATEIQTLKKAIQIGKESGLLYVYMGNVYDGSDTICPSCGSILIGRDGFLIKRYNLSRNRCTFCGFVVSGRFPERYGSDYRLWKGYEIPLI